MSLPTPTNHRRSSTNEGKKVIIPAPIQSIWEDFRLFLNRGSVVDLAIASIMGTALTTVVNSMVADIITPIFSLFITPANLEESFLIIRKPRNCSNHCPHYNTIAEAQAAGAVTWNYGRFLQSYLKLIFVAAMVYIIVRSVAKIFRQEFELVKTLPCRYCTMKIPVKAKRCPECTSHLPFE